MKLADTQDLGSCASRLAGSSPASPTISGPGASRDRHRQTVVKGRRNTTAWTQDRSPRGFSRDAAEVAPLRQTRCGQWNRHRLHSSGTPRCRRTSRTSVAPAAHLRDRPPPGTARPYRPSRDHGPDGA